MEATTTTSQWTVEGRGSFDNLTFSKEAPIAKVGDIDCLVKWEVASLNYRDLVIAKGTYPGSQKQTALIPGSDASGTVISTGPRVTRFKVGDRVLSLFRQGHLSGSLDATSLATGLGGQVDGVFRTYAVFPESGLVACPSNLGFEEAATLPCAAATAWNALYGLESRSLKPGDWVLTQGTGGVSLFGVQFAVAAGARVIATTSSKEKAEKLKELGATHVINYKEDANWGETAKGLTPGRVGVKHILEVGGPATLAQSLKAVHIDGVISIIGFVAGMTAEKPPSFLTLLSNFCCVRGVSVGSRAQFEDMNRAIEANGIRPVVDERVFEMEYLKEAYQYMWEQRHFGKVVVKIARRKDNEKQPSGKL